METKLLAGFRLSEWVVRPEDGSLTSPAGANRLEPLLMELLIFLCSRAGQVVPKQDVLDAVWGGRFVSDETVKGSLYQLRKALGDNPRKPRFIETLPKRGYRILVQPSPLDPELYRKGRAALSGQPDAATLKQARLYFERSIQSDSQNAEALAGLAHTYILMVILGLEQSSEFLPKAKAAAARAAQIDPKLSEAHATMGVVRFLHDRDPISAEEEFRLAIKLDPGDSPAHRWYARFLSSQSRHDEAVAEARRALEADPLSLPVRRDLLDVLFMARRYDETIAEAQHMVGIAALSADVHLGLVWVYYLQEKDRQAVDSFLAALTSMSVAPGVMQHARDAYEQGGMTAIFKLWIEVLEQQMAMGLKAQRDLLFLYALLGNHDRCFALMELAYQEGHPYLPWLAVSPPLDSLHTDPRYSQFIARLSYQPFPNQ